MSSGVSVLQVWRASELVIQVELNGQAQHLSPLVLDETDRIAFELLPREAGLEYDILIGDISLPRAHHGRTGIEWADDVYFDSARGQTSITVASRVADAPEAKWAARARFDVWVYPRKLTESAYQRMFDDLAKLSAGLVLDLLSKSSAGVGSLNRSRPGIVAVRSAQLELRILSRLWSAFSRALIEIMIQPEMGLVARREMMACHGAEWLSPQELVRIASMGVDPRRRDTPRPFIAERSVMAHSFDTIEHRAIAAFLDILAERARECLKRARHESDEIRRDRWFRDRDGPGRQNLYDVMDAPRVARLEDASAKADLLVSQICMARRSFPVVAAARGLRDASSSPVFRNVTHYRHAWRLMVGYLNGSAVFVDASTEERTKQTWRMYEQWVFLQLAAAFRGAGLQCCSQRDFVNALSAKRFTVDLQRGARLVFVAPDDRRVVMRYEPWIFSRKVAADLGETVYQGSEGEVPWSPDVLIEFMRPIDAGRFGLEYAIVVDAKYVRHIRDNHREQCLKYMKIRNVETGEAIVRQVWLAHPVEKGITLDDDALAWTASGPTAHRHEVVMGALGLAPPLETPDHDHGYNPNVTAQEFVDCTLGYLDFPLSNSVTPVARKV